MLSTVGPRRALHHNLTAAAHAHTHTHTRSFIFLPFCGQLPRRRPPADAARLLLLLQRVTERRVVVRWEWAGAEAGWVRVQGGSGSSSVEYDIDLITLRRVPRRAEGVVEARAEVKEKAEKGAAAAGKKGEKEKAGVEPEVPGSKKEKEKEKAEKEKAEKERDKAEKEKKEKEKEKAEKEREKAEDKKEKDKKEKEKKDKKEKEKKEKEKEEKEKAKEKESKPPSKDSSSIDLPVKTTKANTSEILAKIIKDQTDELQQMAPPALPEKPTGRKEVTTPAAPEAATEAPAKPKSSQPASVAQSTKVGDLTKVAKETPAPSPTSIKTDTIKPSPTTGTIPATAVPKNQQAAVTPQVKQEPPKLALGKVSKEAQESPDADIDLLRPSDIRAAAGIPAKVDPKADTKKEKAKQTTTTTTAEADTNAPPPQKKPRESPEELRKRMRRIADSLDLGPIDKFIPSKDHHDHHDYEWSGTEDVSAEDVLKRPSPPAEPIQKPMPPPTSDPAPLIEPVVPTMPFTEPPTPPPQPPPIPPAQPPPTPTPKNYYILVRNPDTGSMHFTPLPHSLISDFPTLSSRESTAFDAMRRLTSPEAFLPLWRVLQRGGFEVVGGERDCLVVMVEREGSRIRYGEVVKEVRGLALSPAERVARGAWERRRRGKEVEAVEKEKEVVVEKLLEGRKAPRRKIFWSAVWVAACTGAVTVGLETYL